MNEPESVLDRMARQRREDNEKHYAEQIERERIWSENLKALPPTLSGWVVKKDLTGVYQVNNLPRDDTPRSITWNEGSVYYGGSYTSEKRSYGKKDIFTDELEARKQLRLFINAKHRQAQKAVDNWDNIWEENEKAIRKAKGY
jgi:hypothetical protein